MRFPTFAALGLVAAVLAGCAAPVPPATTVATPVAPVVTAPTVLDAASRQVARTAINAQMAQRLQGVDVTPYTDCVVNNATTAELIDIAQASRAGVATADSVAAIVSRPATTQCIAAAARTA